MRYKGLFMTSAALIAALVKITAVAAITPQSSFIDIFKTDNSTAYSKPCFLLKFS